jgi:hypothetical protein
MLQPSGWRVYMQDESMRWGRVVKENNIRME